MTDAFDKLVIAYRDLNRADSDLVQRLASEVIGSAKLQRETVDSQLILKLLQEHNNETKRINKELFGE